MVSLALTFPSTSSDVRFISLASVLLQLFLCILFIITFSVNFVSHTNFFLINCFGSSFITHNSITNGSIELIIISGCFLTLGTDSEAESVSTTFSSLADDSWFAKTSLAVLCSARPPKQLFQVFTRTDDLAPVFVQRLSIFIRNCKGNWSFSKL